VSSSRPVEIVGGGLAGLSLGLALRQAGIAVTVFEAGAYPRHRVCGEFVTGLGATTIARLGLDPLLQGAGRLREVAWLVGGRVVRRHRLPAPALALSRHTLDARLAGAFTAAGGHLLTGTRMDPNEVPEGRVFATGRRRAPDKRATWLGLKLHARGLRLTSELEFHLGDGAYVGLCPVEDGWVNVCGLFRPRSDLAADRATVLAGYLRATGLDTLAARLAEAEICAASCSAVAGVGFDRRGAESDRLNLGDTFAMIPPFTGNGMAMAFQSAEEALDPLLAWARGEAAWAETVCRTGGRMRRRFRRRLAAAAAVHPFLHSPSRQRWLALAARSGLLPLRPLYHLLH
jgi:flavin-dependent dehydrogenase